MFSGWCSPQGLVLTAGAGAHRRGWCSPAGTDAHHRGWCSPQRLGLIAMAGTYRLLGVDGVF